ncbi:UNVERIFIED_ORG: hypothetical protein J2X79_003766 [Arthrobacter globiformis]|nr:hypothetical protein [Arthrobacter globiformis]
MSIVDFMRVSAPFPPSAAVRRADITGIKLARHVAVLFGVDVPDNPTGVVWVSDFSKVTVGDIGRGAPKSGKAKADDVGYLPLKAWYLVGRSLVAGPVGKPQDTGTTSAVHVGEVDEVPSATLNRFKPDTKAAALVAGAEQLFAGLEEVFRDTIRVLGTLDDGSRLDDRIRIGIWASLVAEVYRSQPALFTAAIQARLTQRAALSNWRPVIAPRQSADSAGCEFGGKEGDDWEPAHLGILDGVMKDYIQPYFRPYYQQPGKPADTENSRPTDSPGGGKTEPTSASETDGPTASDTDIPAESSEQKQDSDPNQEYLLDGLVDRWCRHLTQSPDRGLAWTVQEGRRRTVEIYLSGANPLSRFLAEVHALTPRILPYGMENREDNWQRFEAKNENHRRRLRPRIPSRAELSPLPERSQLAIVHTLMCLHRVFRTNAAFNHPQMVKEVSEDQLRVAELSESLWGANAPLAAWSRHLWIRGKISSARERDAEFVDRNWPSFMEGLRQLRQLREDGRISTGEWVDIFSGVSPDLNARSRDLAARNAAAEAKALRTETLEYWKELLRLLNIDDELGDEPSSSGVTANASMTQAALLLHNYVGVALRAETVHERVKAVRFGRRVVLPLRRLVAEDRKNDAVARMSTQILARAAARIVTDTDDESIRSEMLDVCFVLLNDLLKTKLVKELLSENRAPETASDLNVLNAISQSALTLLESGSENAPLSIGQTKHVLDLAATALTVLSGEHPADPRNESDRARDVRRFRERWNKLSATGT